MIAGIRLGGKRSTDDDLTLVILLFWFDQASEVNVIYIMVLRRFASRGSNWPNEAPGGFSPKGTFLSLI